MLAPDDYDDPFEAMAEGRPPNLSALLLHTGTVWRWNRACYGVSNGVPHLRIENRVLPSGPSTVDEVANAALWLGLMRARRHAAPRRQPADGVRAGPGQPGGGGPPGVGAPTSPGSTARTAPPSSLALDHLLPLAADGLDEVGIDPADRDRYLGVIERRIRSGHTGSRWLLTSLDGLRAQGSEGQRLNSVTAAMVARQKAGSPVSEWTAASLDEGGGWRHNFVTIEQLMVTDLVTVAEDDPVELAANLMDWHRIRQVLVEDADHHLVGLVSYRTILRLFSRGLPADRLADVPVGDVMRRNPVCVPPDIAPLRALELMRSFGIGALPVVHGEQLVGLVTEHDFMNVAGVLLLQQLTEANRKSDASSAAALRSLRQQASQGSRGCGNGALECQREPVHARRDLDQRGKVRLVFRLATRVHPLDEQLDRRRVCAPRRQGRERHDPLAIQPEPLAARRKYDHLRAARTDRRDQVRGTGQHMLTVVQHQQQALPTEAGTHRHRQRLARLGSDPQAVRRGLDDVLDLRCRRQLDPRHAVGKFGGHRFGRCQRKSRLADAAGSGQRHQPGLQHALGELVEVAGASNHPAQLTRPGATEIT